MTNQEFLESITLEGEEWRDVIGLHGKYVVSSLGRVASIPNPQIATNGLKKTKGQILKQTKSSNGYYYISMYDIDGRHIYKAVHRIIAEAFIPNPNEYKQIDHINTVRTDNSIQNLRWCTHEMNQRNPLTRLCHSVNRKGRQISKAKGIVQLLNGRKIGFYRTSTEAALVLNLCYSMICRCCRGEQKSYAGFEWMYLSDYDKSSYQ